MAQPQQQYPMPQRSFSPPQSAASPGAQQHFGQPPNKRQRLSPNPSSQPSSPYLQSPYGMSPTTTANTGSGASPHFSNVAIPPGAYTTPYQNGNPNPALTLPQSQPNHQSQSQNQPPFQGSVSFANPQHTAPRPIFGDYMPAQSQQQQPYPGQNQPQHPPSSQPPNQHAGTMGPPSKPAEKAKEDGLDPMDLLAGTGIDLREEEQYMFKSFNSNQTDSQPSNASYRIPPGDRASFYGAGPANVVAEKTNGKSQDDYIQEQADKLWVSAAHRLAQSRQNELANPFLQVALVTHKMQKAARENGLSLNVEKNGHMGVMKLPEQFSNREVRAQTALGTDVGFVATSGPFLHGEAMLVDQVALLSIATKHRLEGLIRDAVKLSRGRQTGSHGVVPVEWSNVAVAGSFDSQASESGLRNGWESALSPHSNPLNHSLSGVSKLPTPVSDSATPPTAPIKFTSEIAAALRTSATLEQAQEEARLRKRQDRANGGGTAAASRQGSIVPGTPGSVAPDTDLKAPTKKEQRKKADAKVNEAATHAAANTTTAQFLGVGGGMFGKKKKYNWLTGSAAGGGASGSSTPGRINTQGLPGTPGIQPVSAPPEKLTADGVRRLGEWRDDGLKGRRVQIRDWISVLEQDGREKMALQKAYVGLDQSDPK
ncbi:hypothetical protein MBM_01771 [Drepanopeziza brunnea f. sp. 'multigermtubi' MB_m1]|uniref:Transcription initiation factor TFIID subunit 4 n=1 Tax=Marssonina brunnea f. sp. multigermtubi (strain MB_m1) TaxID=1072389 RepID=K1Y3Q2_MARBU|nr:uncharacterized protein MBM_01771 [Drepanopeziza brunnea f. sp. 'multigermtubi' MB_m1]EKD19819.1 hypothetical protein MBM_01771 [Drepanopeziza brunnea f. sp. 'multigermtubi' MB_m1]